MRFTVLLLLFVSSLQGLAQIPIDSISYGNDLAIYRKALEESHPSLYRFTSKEKFDSMFNSIEANLSDKTTELDFFRSVSQISSLVREGHSYVQPPESLSSTVQNKSLFPFQVLVENDKVIVKNSRVEELDYLKNIHIESINGQSIKSILNVLAESASTVSAFNNSRLKSNLSLYNNFALAYFYFIDTTSNFLIKYRAASTSKPISLEVKGSSHKLTNLNYPELPPEPEPPFYLDIDEQNSLATMRISTFAYWVVGKKMKDYSKFYKESFASLQNKGIKHLIIDVRGNRGGEEMLAGDLLTYLIDYEFRIYKYCKAKTMDFNFTNSLPNSNKIKLARNNYIATDSGYVMKKADFLKPYPPKNEYHFDGSVYVISNGICASACNIFLALVKTHDIGIIIGQESGGAFEDVDGRHRISFNLPYSGIFVSYPAWNMKLDTRGGDKLRGVIPDYEIKPTVQKLTSGADEEMTLVLKLINQKSE